MAKKRSCRRTTDENVIHDKAVKIRKMTDEQLAIILRTGWKKPEARDSTAEKSRHYQKRTKSVLQKLLTRLGM